MRTYNRPGAYYERVDRAQATAAEIRTDVCALVGIARQGPLDTPVPVESFRQFQSQFGGFTGSGYLAYAVKAFFENDGTRLWVVRVASRRPDLGARAARLTVGSWQIAASSPGQWGNGLSFRIRRERRIEVRLDALGSNDGVLQLESAVGLARLDHVEITQAGQPAQYAVLADVDAAKAQAFLFSETTPFGYRDQRITLDPQASATLATISYAIDIYREGRLIAHVPGLTQVPDHPRFGPLVLGQPDYARALQNGQPAGVAPALIVTDTQNSTRQPPTPLTLGSANRQMLNGGRDGLTRLAPEDFTGGAFFGGDDTATALSKQRGLRTLELVREVSVVAVPDITIRPDIDPLWEPEMPPPDNGCLTCPPPREPRRLPGRNDALSERPPIFSDAQIFQVQSALLAHCEDQCDRFAVLDPPWNTARDDAAGLAAIAAWRSRFDSGYGALYYPWIKANERREKGVLRDIPPSGHVLGQIAQHDRTTGVHRAPANTRLIWLQDLTVHPAIGAQEALNDISVNLIRSEAGRGLRIMGARTLSSDPLERYVNVRRLILAIKRAVDVLSQWVVFEPNNTDTRIKYTAVLENFLTGLHGRGAFAGANPAESFFVKCDDENNSQADRDAGRLIAEIGVAPAFPMEFVVMRVGRQGNALNIREPSDIASAA